MTGGTRVIEIRNVGVTSGSVYSSYSGATSGGLVGLAHGASLTIINSYFCGSGGVSSKASASSRNSRSGGLVGDTYPPTTPSTSTTTLTITNSYFCDANGVSSEASSSSSFSYAGGLVGSSSTDSTLTIKNSYFDSAGGVSSAATTSVADYSSRSGGLVGNSFSTLTITNSYFSSEGEIFSSAPSSLSYSGGLVGYRLTNMTFTDNYWNKGAVQKVTNIISGDKQQRTQTSLAYGNVGTSSSEGGLILRQLKDGTHPSNLGDAWDLGTNTQLPAVKLCIDPTTTNGVTTCASHGALLPGQR